MEFLSLVDGTIYAYPPRGHPDNKTGLLFHDLQADFGRSIPRDGIFGYLALANPINACTPVEPPPKNKLANYFLLVQEAADPKAHCRYTTQVFNAQKANYDAVIIFRHDPINRLVLMGGEGPIIPSVYVLREAGIHLQEYLYDTGSTIKITADPQLPLQLYLIPFAVVVGVCFFFMVIFSVARYARFRIRERRARLTPANLKKIPTKKFKKGEDYDMCAICIEEFEEGEKLRLLPCNHVYHCKCVDPWLTAGKKLCPICKKSVEVPKKKNRKRTVTETFDGASTSSHPVVTETEDDFDSSDEQTPLLSDRDRDSVPSSPQTIHV